MVLVLKEMAVLNKTQLERLAVIKEADVAEEQHKFVENVMASQEVRLWTESHTMKSMGTYKNKGMDVSAENNEMLTEVWSQIVLKNCKLCALRLAVSSFPTMQHVQQL